MSLCLQMTLLKRFTKKNEIQKCFLFQNLTDTDSTSLLFIFVNFRVLLMKKLPET